MERRYLVALVQEHRVLEACEFTELPSDVTVLSVHHLPLNKAFAFTLYHPEFKEVPFGEPLPSAVVSLKARSDKATKLRAIELVVPERKVLMQQPRIHSRAQGLVSRDMVRVLWPACPVDAELIGHAYDERNREYHFVLKHASFKEVETPGAVPKVRV